MSNFDERLTAELVKLQGRAIKDWESDIAKAKQAITALIKELVAEAKPEEYEDYYASNPVEKGHKMGYNEAAREFEQNLLKALEEV